MAERDASPFAGMEKPERPQRSGWSPQAREMALTARRLQRDPFIKQDLRYPETPEEWRSWAQSLSRVNLHKAMELDEILKRRGRKGIHDPNLSGLELEAVQRFLARTVPHWNTVMQQQSRPPRRRATEKPAAKAPTEDLEDFDDALPLIGGRPER